MRVGNKEVRELWKVTFVSAKFKSARFLDREDIIVGVLVWAITGDEALEIVRNNPPDNLPYINTLALEQVQTLESHIINQPKVVESERGQERQVRGQESVQDMNASVLVGVNGEGLGMGPGPGMGLKPGKPRAILGPDDKEDA